MVGEVRSARSAAVMPRPAGRLGPMALWTAGQETPALWRTVSYGSARGRTASVDEGRCHGCAAVRPVPPRRRLSGGRLFRFRVPAAFAAAWPHHAGLGDGDPTELCTDERLDALAAASFGYLAGARLLVQNLADGLGGTPVLHVKPEAGWFAVVAARIGGRG